MKNLDYLIKYLLKENKENVNIPNDIEEKKQLYKTLCNVRMPKPISKEYINIENKYLQEELLKKGIIDIKNIKSVDNDNIKNKEIIGIWQGDITRLKIDSVVNPANSQGLGCFNPNHKCLDNILGLSAGVCLRLECDKIMKKRNYNLKTGESIITNGYNLPSKYIIHTVGPIINNKVTKKEKQQLALCYINCLELAKKNNIKTIAFPCISTGIFSFPKDIACNIAIKTVDNYLDNNKNYFERIIFCVFSQEDYNYYMNYGKNINNDLKKLLEILLSDKPSVLIKENEDYIFDILPELKKAKNFNQNNPWHIYDVYEHILHVIDGVENNIILRLTALFHDIGKPYAYTEDQNNIGHFYNHWIKSSEIFLDFSKKYKLPNNLTCLVEKLIYYHDINIAKLNEQELNKFLDKFTIDEIALLYEIKKNDLLAQSTKYHYLLAEYELQKKYLLHKKNGGDFYRNK